MERISIEETIKKTGEKVKVCGWVHTRRDHGKIIFIDLRDRSGLLQVVFQPTAGHPQGDTLYDLAQDLRSEWVISVEGTINKRPKGMINSNLPTGEIELKVEKLEILNKAETPPFTLETDGYEIGEDNRLKYRYVDLRRERMKNNLILRHKVIQFIRNFLSERGFIEIETPILTKSTPEGARDYVVPSRVHHGNFYALPQSPQQYKQLLMVAGIEKYFQIARCFRDEDTRGDRQPEFTQLDLEMSFPTQDEILSLTEELYIKIIKTLIPEKHITKIPFPRLGYDEVMKKYKTDKPDLRKNPKGKPSASYGASKKDPDELAFAWIIDWPLFEWNKDEKRWDPMHHVFTAPKDEDVPLLDKDPSKVRSWQHDLVLNGNEIGGGSIRIHKPEIQEKVFKLVGLKEEEIKTKFGHLLHAFTFGAPPHGGIASGIDRLIMILANEPSIREVMAFPKTGDGKDLMMNAPSKIDPKQLKELGIKFQK
ncbi:MAG: aspartate--tRNA ligase [Candidatus Portnoybacteria bacterium CG10_big_fil_rev_8_21_14_0_10_38_18]|uniref:Aspartate--tRNA(Asp/Asn) ligase n=1 Tax=Candidatus Portnoybacteria bacterium CG10_big_fil_rev_8_21_14_0_10_38_18 TaxID=1974813 RepID=A0A2M8KCN0_9BACT|nr:MAG: aspartate--tRNA ligase [Candidatus Portnoybacteria bacterium CG10_big_fil_rev_8_21_14_0_10_38_18]